MEKQEKEECVQTIQTIKSKNKKKNKNKEKKRIMSLFRGPKVDQNFYCKVNEEEVNAIKNALIDIMTRNPDIKLHKNMKNKSLNDDKNKMVSQLKLTDELILGLNAIIRAIEKKSTIGVIISDPLAIQLTDRIIELCEEKRIACLSVDSFAEMNTHLNISSLTGMAFKPNSSSSEAIFYELYKTFLNIVNMNCNINQNISDTNEQNESLDISQDITTFKTTNSEQTWDQNLSNILYTKESDDNYCELYRNKMKRVNDSLNKMDVISTLESFLPISGDSAVYFPKKENENKIIAKIEVIVDEDLKSRDESFAESLMEVSVEKVQKQMKRKSCQKSKANSILSYSAPQIVRLEPSTHKMVNRKQRKLSKKKPFKNN